MGVLGLAEEEEEELGRESCATNESPATVHRALSQRSARHTVTYLTHRYSSGVIYCVSHNGGKTRCVCTVGFSE